MKHHKGKSLARSRTAGPAARVVQPQAPRELRLDRLVRLLVHVVELEGVPGQVEELVLVHVGEAVPAEDLTCVAHVLVLAVLVLAAALVVIQSRREISRQKFALLHVSSFSAN